MTFSISTDVSFEQLAESQKTHQQKVKKWRRENRFPLPIEDSQKMLRATEAWFDSVGQADGFWVKGAPIADMITVDHPLVDGLHHYNKRKPGWRYAVSRKVAGWVEGKMNEGGGAYSYEAFALDMLIAHNHGIDYLCGHRAFCFTQRGPLAHMVQLMLFPPIDTFDRDQLVTFFAADEVFPLLGKRTGVAR